MAAHGGYCRDVDVFYSKRQDDEVVKHGATSLQFSKVIT